MTVPNAICQLKVTLDDSEPAIWRRLLVPENISLYDLHEILQIAMGWTNSHLHEFTIARKNYGDPEDDELDNQGTRNETDYRLNQLYLREKTKFSYLYDFGDNWEHTISVEKILPPDSYPTGMLSKSAGGIRYPVCLEGKRACPPDDVGGVWGYANFLQAMADPNHEDHDDYFEWLGGNFDPEAFDLEEVNRNLKTIKPAPGRRKAQNEPKPEEMADFALSVEQQEAQAKSLAVWVKSLSPEQAGILESLPIRRDMLTLLDYLSKNRTVGTQSTGNLPLKAVHEICKNFIHPPILEETTNNHTYKVRSEDDVWPLLFVHILASQSGLVAGGPAKIWKVTSEGQLFSQFPPPVQVFSLLVHWCVQLDWRMAFPVSGLDKGFPVGFKEKTLACLRELPLGENVPHNAFADRLIAQSGLTWPSQNQTNAHSIMQSVIKRVVVDMMAIFGVLQCVYVTEISNGYKHEKLESIRLTPIGKELLDLLE